MFPGSRSIAFSMSWYIRIRRDAKQACFETVQERLAACLRPDNDDAARTYVALKFLFVRVLGQGAATHNMRTMQKRGVFRNEERLVACRRPNNDDAVRVSSKVPVCLCTQRVSHDAC